MRRNTRKIRQKSGQIVLKPDTKNPKIKFTDASGKTKTLYIVEQSAQAALSELPPVPPSPVFDVRFSNDLFNERLSDGKRNSQYSISHVSDQSNG